VRQDSFRRRRRGAIQGWLVGGVVAGGRGGDGRRRPLGIRVSRRCCGPPVLEEEEAAAAAQRQQRLVRRRWARRRIGWARAAALTKSTLATAVRHINYDEHRHPVRILLGTPLHEWFADDRLKQMRATGSVQWRSQESVPGYAKC